MRFEHLVDLFDDQLKEDVDGVFLSYQVILECLNILVGLEKKIVVSHVVLLEILTIFFDLVFWKTGEQYLQVVFNDLLVIVVDALEEDEPLDREEHVGVVLLIDLFLFFILHLKERLIRILWQ